MLWLFRVAFAFVAAMEMSRSCSERSPSRRAHAGISPSIDLPVVMVVEACRPRVGVSMLLPPPSSRVDLKTGKVEVLYKECDGHPLRGPNDIVFDRSGGFWFTDHGKVRERERDRTGVYYAKPDGSMIREAIFPIDSPNGVGLSPDEKKLY